MLSQPWAMPSPGSGVSQHKENAKVRQHRAVSLGFPVLTLILSTLNTRLPRVYCSPLRLPSFPPTCCPPGSSDKAGGGRGAGERTPTPVCDQRRSHGDQAFTDIGKHWIRTRQLSGDG